MLYIITTSYSSFLQMKDQDSSTIIFQGFIEEKEREGKKGYNFNVLLSHVVPKTRPC